MLLWCIKQIKVVQKKKLKKKSGLVKILFFQSIKQDECLHGSIQIITHITENSFDRLKEFIIDRK